MEDAADDFQKVQDLVNTQAYLEVNTSLRSLLSSQPISNVIFAEDVI